MKQATAASQEECRSTEEQHPTLCTAQSDTKMEGVDLPRLSALLAGRMGDFSYWMQTCSALALATTFLRVVRDQSLPVVFMGLPLGLLVMPNLARWRKTQTLLDPVTRETITGVVTGVACGFLSAVTEINFMHVTYLSKTQSTGPIDIFGPLEILHFPILLGALLHSFQASFTRFPTVTSLLTAAMTAFFGDLLLTISYGILGLQVGDPLPLSSMTRLFIQLYIVLLIISILPLCADVPRAWLLHLLFIMTSLYWQTTSLGVATWQTRGWRFPVPGAIVGVLYAFHGAKPLNDPRAWEKKGHQPVLPRYWIDTSEEFPIPIGNLHTKIPSSMMWFILCFVVERLSLLWLYVKPTGTDCQVTCFVLVVFVWIMSSAFSSTLCVRALASAELALIYICWTFTTNTLLNGVFIDIVCGLTLVCIVTHRTLAPV